MGYFSREDEKRKEDIYNWTEQNFELEERTEEKEPVKKTLQKSAKQELIDSIIKEEPTRNRQLLDSFSEYSLQKILKQVLLNKKQQKLIMKKTRYQNPYEKYDQDYEQEEINDFRIL